MNFGWNSAWRALAPRGAAVAVTAVLLWLVVWPLALLLLEALRTPDGFGLAHFAEFARRLDEWVALGRSLWISVASVVLAAAVGVPLAFFFERNAFPGRSVLGALAALPIALPPLVGVIAFLFLYGESGFLARGLQHLLGLREAPWRLHGPGAILLVHAYSMYAYFYLFTRAGLARLDASLLEAAAILGAGRGRIFWRVVLPQLRPALLGATLLTLMTSLGSFSAPYIFAGGYRVMTTQIVASKLSGELALAQVEAVMLALVALLALGWIRALQGPDLTGAGHGLAPAPPPPARRPWVRWTKTALAAGFLLLAVLPHLTLLLISFVPADSWTVELLPPELSWGNYQQLFAQPERLRPMLNSLWMATVATAGAVVLGLLAARHSLARGSRWGMLLETLIALPWAVPGTVFAVALATTFSVDAPLLARFVWVGTPILLPLAYLARALPMTGRAALAGLRQLDPALGEAAASLGAGPLRTFLRVTLPLIRPALAAGTSLAMIAALGDFVSSVVLYTFETRPISLEIQSTLRLQEFGVAAAYGVLLMILASFTFLIWGREGEAR